MTPSGRGLQVTTEDLAVVGDVAHASDVAIHELRSEQTHLEELFFNLTESEEHRNRNLGRDAPVRAGAPTTCRRRAAPPDRPRPARRAHPVQPSAADDAKEAATMTAAVRAEFRKLFTTRLWWGMAIAVSCSRRAFAVLFAFVFTSDAVQGPQAAAAPSTDAELAKAVFTGGLQVGYLLTLAIGVMTIGSEYRHQTITATFLADPAPGPRHGAPRSSRCSPSAPSTACSHWPAPSARARSS